MSQTPQTLTMSDIPADQLDALAKDYKEMGAAKIEVLKQPDGKFTLKVTLDADEEEAARS
jgi:hypothetical protein